MSVENGAHDEYDDAWLNGPDPETDPYIPYGLTPEAAGAEIVALWKDKSLDDAVSNPNDLEERALHVSLVIAQRRYDRVGEEPIESQDHASQRASLRLEIAQAALTSYMLGQNQP